MLISGTTGIDLTGLPINNSGNAEVEGNLNLSATSVVQPNITNTNMIFKVSPSGNATFTSLIGYNSSDISNTHFGQIAVRNDAVTIDSSKTGTGTFKPLKLGVGGSYPIVIDTGNNLSLGSGFQGVGALLPDNGEMTIKPVSTGGGVRISATASDYSSLPSWMSTSLGQYGSAASGNYITGIPRANLGMLWGQNITNMIIGSNSSSPLVFVNSSTERMRIDTTGNVGIGVTPSAWGSSWKSLDLLSSSITSYTTLTDPYTIISNNAYISGSSSTLSSVYKNNGSANSYNQGGGSHVWRTAPSGTAGNAITWTNAMTLDANGNLLLKSGTGALGYGTGAGGVVTQLTSKSTAVALNKPSGVIIMNNAALAAGASTSFIVNNTIVSAAGSIVDNVIVSIYSGISGYSNYRVQSNTINGGFVVTLTNQTGISLSEAVLLKFDVIKGATA